VSPWRHFWRTGTHLRAKNRSRGTIDSYLTVGAAFGSWLTERHLSTEHTAITPQHARAVVAVMHERIAPAMIGVL
jgi:hypothetical protein